MKRSNKLDALPFRERITCSVRDGMKVSGFGQTKFYELLATGRIQSRLVDGKRLVSVPSLLALLEGPQEIQIGFNAEGQPANC